MSLITSTFFSLPGSVSGDTRAPTAVTPAPTTARPTSAPTRVPTAAPTFSEPCMRLRPGGGPFDQGDEIHSRTQAKKTKTIKTIHGVRQLKMDSMTMDGASQVQQGNGRSLTGHKPAGITTGKHLRVTQVIKSSLSQTLVMGTLSFLLPDYATFGKVKTQPAYLTIADQELQQKAISGEIPGLKGEKIRDRLAGRGTLFLQTPQLLFWKMDDVYPKKTYKISFTIKLIAPPPPGVDELIVKSTFVAALINADTGAVTVVDCDDERELPLTTGAKGHKV